MLKKQQELLRDDFKDSEDSKKNVDAVKEKGKNTPKLKENSNIEMFADDSTANYIGNSIDSIHVEILTLLDELRYFGLKPTQCFFILQRQKSCLCPRLHLLIH